MAARSAVGRKVESIKRLLRTLNFPEGFVTSQTAICLLALSDGRKRSGLLPGKVALKDGARIHDILEFARTDLGIPVAENTRESYRKTSLKPLNEAGLITRRQLSTNDPNTFYRLHPDLSSALQAPRAVTGEAVIERLRRGVLPGLRRDRPPASGEVRVLVGPGKHFSASRGDHNQLEKDVVESFGPAFPENPKVIFLGDAARKTGYQDRVMMRELNLPITVTAGLPDVILFSEAMRELVVAEAVVSTGAINESRLAQLFDLTSASARLGFRVEFLTAFPSRVALRRFVDQIAWGTAVWVASEPNNLILFQRRPPAVGK